MKNVVLAIAAVLLLIAVPAAAQYGDTTATTAPSTDLTNTQQPAETRTNAAVPTHSNDPGLTATGSVESSNADEVVIHTATGLTHIKLLPSTVGTRTFTVGETIAVDFTRNEQGVLLAKQIRSAEPMAVAPPGVTTTGAAQAGAAVESAVENVGEAVEEGVEETTNSDVDNDGAIGTRGAPTGSTATTTTTTVDTTTTSLPATGSNSPLFGLLGLLALGGAAALRRL